MDEATAIEEARKIIAIRSTLRSAWVKPFIEQNSLCILDSHSAEKSTLVLAGATKVFLQQLVTQAKMVAQSESNGQRNTNDPLEPRHYLDAFRRLERSTNEESKWSRRRDHDGSPEPPPSRGIIKKFAIH